MPQITLSKTEVRDFARFLLKYDLQEWFIAKDHGAYVGATTDGHAWLKYFKGCDPEKNQDWWETTRTKFGYDDFGEMFPTEYMVKAAAKNGRVVLKLTDTSVEAELYH